MMNKRVCSPESEQIRQLRETVQAALGMGITAAQAHCAVSLHAGLRTWQQWERGERRMHPAFWELAQLKLAEK